MVALRAVHSLQRSLFSPAALAESRHFRSPPAAGLVSGRLLIVSALHTHDLVGLALETNRIKLWFYNISDTKEKPCAAEDSDGSD